MYCIKCGVELADSEKRCPLCGTPVFHPDLPRNLTEPPYPADRRIRREDVNRSGILFVLTVVALLPAILSLLCDWRIRGYGILTQAAWNMCAAFIRKHSRAIWIIRNGARNV